MRVKYFASTSLDEIESTVNNLLGLGWEMQMSHPFRQENGEYLMAMITHDRRPHYYTEARETGQRPILRAERAPEPLEYYDEPSYGEAAGLSDSRPTISFAHSVGDVDAFVSGTGTIPVETNR